MTLSAGAKLGPYEILAAIGAGGMGEVYRARDTRLNRDVAIKILPEQFARDPDRISRFQREAEVLASLNHPNIAHIHGVEEAQGIRALILEFVDGPTLADRIAQGPIPIEDALPIARQIAEALEAAHERGIIHRDLKPANVKLTPEGIVKVLDFGLAKALDSRSESSPFHPNAAAALGAPGLSPGGLLSQSPTLTSPVMTRMGVILGTAVYMSPEQAKGRPADRRSDVWAFGCVLYEMLTGKRAFDGEDLTETIAAVVRGDPDWSALPADVPPHVRTLVKGCLEKDHKARISDIAVARFLLDKGSTLAPAIAPASTSAVPQRPRWQSALKWGAAALMVTGVASVLYLWRPWNRAPSAAPLRLSAELGATASLPTIFGASAILSPDGTTLAFVADQELSGNSVLYVRLLNQLQATSLSGTDGALNPFFSPDGRWIAFFAQGKLKKVAVTGGTPITLCDAPLGRGGSWSEEGTIVFSPNTPAGTTLQRVSSDGGTPEKLLEIADREINQRWPQVLPGGKAVLFTSAQAAGNYANANIIVQGLPNGPRKTLIKGGYYGQYVRSGHLVYMQQRTLFAAPFDLDRLELTGPAVPALEGAISGLNSGGAQVAFSDTGTVVYVPGESVADRTPIRWLDRSGKTSILRDTPADWSSPSFAPDGRRLAIDIYDGTQNDVWVYEWERDTLSRLTFDQSDDLRPVWSPDGRYIAFTSRRGDKTTFNLYTQRADGTGEVQRLTDSKNNQYPTSWHPSGKFLAFLENVPGSQTDVMILPMEGDPQRGWKPGTPTAFLKEPFSESTGTFSPDGRWIAYLSNEGGRLDVYVRPFPGPGGKFQISTAAADDPTWSRTTRELFFLSSTDVRLMVVPYRVNGDAFQADKPAVLSETRLTARPRPPSRDLDLHPDGKRFAVAASDERTSSRPDKVVFVFNFFDELRRIAPARK